MKPIRFEEANKDLRHKTNKDVKVGSVKNVKLTTCYINGVYVSCWALSLVEKIRVLFGRKIWLGTKSGCVQPPVWLGINNPFKPNKS